MAELIAEGAEPQQRWRIALVSGHTYRLGRDQQCDLPVPWDGCISRVHAELRVERHHLQVRCLAAASNPLFFHGKPVETCELRIGEHFAVGDTCFAFASSPKTGPVRPSQPIEEVTFSREELRRTRFQDADRRIEVLSHLPEVIWGARTDQELYVRLVTILLAGITGAEAAAVVAIEQQLPVRVLHWERRLETAGEFRPSSRLIKASVLDRKQSVLHVWESKDQQPMDFTATQESDWAFCTPVQGTATQGWGLYLAGRFDQPTLSAGRTEQQGRRLQGDVKFAELMAEIISSVRRLNQLERQQASLRQFFAPIILSALGDDLDTELLQPRESDVTVLFCDLRGFSKQAEGSRDNLIELLDRVSQALGVMTRHILAHGGVIGDFQGDAAMGFWGWPVAAEEAPLNACRAALDIRAAFAATASQKDHPLADFQMGIGLAHGRAVAGKIGTSDHVKVTVFGPVVNLASRLEGMTKQLRVPILLDEPLAEIVRSRLPQSEGRLGQLAKVLPYAMQTPVTVSELLPSHADYPQLSNAHLETYQKAVEHFIDGQWEEAYRALHDLPPGDRAQDFLAVLIAQHNRMAPSDWDGIVKLPSK